MRANYKMQRLYVSGDLAEGIPVEPSPPQAHYLLNVLRLGEGAELLLFNGRDGEWRATLALSGKKKAVLRPLERTRPQPPLPDLLYCFAPLKQGRLDYMVQKAVEMGVGVLQPVITQHTHVTRVNLERMRANVVEAAQQCGILTLAEVAEPLPFERMLQAIAPGQLLVFCDEDADVRDPVAALHRAGDFAGIAVLLGPEGGFSDAERQTLLRCPKLLRISLGPRILRADTAAVAALALVQAVLGDWGSR
jgi:16S rRNA (uracil1498-N3)-methyltransferase